MGNSARDSYCGARHASDAPNPTDRQPNATATLPAQLLASNAPSTSSPTAAKPRSQPLCSHTPSHPAATLPATLHLIRSEPGSGGHHGSDVTVAVVVVEVAAVELAGVGRHGQVHGTNLVGPVDAAAGAQQRVIALYHRQQRLLAQPTVRLKLGLRVRQGASLALTPTAEGIRDCSRSPCWDRILLEHRTHWDSDSAICCW